MGGGWGTGEDGPDVEHGEDAEDVEAPLVGGRDEGADEAADDEHPAHEDGGEDVGERQAGCEEELEEQEWEGDEPLDVANILEST